jgi:ABC-type spermidine/putrescine transport system permease subunit II
MVTFRLPPIGIARCILRLKPSLRLSVYSAFAILFLTGAGWLVADWQKDIAGDEAWQQAAAYLLTVHGGGAMVTLLLLGALIPLHVRRGWRSGKNLISGSLMVSLNALLIATAFGLYYLGSETLRPWIKWSHVVVGFWVPLLFAAHIVLGRRQAP